LPSSVFPLYHVLADVAEFNGAEVLPVSSTNPLCVIGLALVKHKMMRVMCANLTEAEESISILGINGKARIRRLTETNAERAMFAPEAYRSDPLDSMANSSGKLTFNLSPYGIARIDVEVTA